MKLSVRNLVILSWLLFFVVMTLIYFLLPELFYRMTSYPGPGSPFVQTPQ